ncbi:hypothetical protein [Acidocella sp.]|uniref:hypothetical protein n=1 Tax=Acidocella sp. TaxID=50710 RepID=UPI0017B8E4CD|nr:hypothetical protein [Acidocella sp.]NNM56309.1 hypothetical protein [Acidocella sp.]
MREVLELPDLNSPRFTTLRGVLDVAAKAAASMPWLDAGPVRRCEELKLNNGFEEGKIS